MKHSGTVGTEGRTRCGNSSKHPPGLSCLLGLEEPGWQIRLAAFQRIHVCRAWGWGSSRREGSALRSPAKPLADWGQRCLCVLSGHSHAGKPIASRSTKSCSCPSSSVFRQKYPWKLSFLLYTHAILPVLGSTFSAAVFEGTGLGTRASRPRVLYYRVGCRLHFAAGTMEPA